MSEVNCQRCGKTRATYEHDGEEVHRTYGGTVFKRIAWKAGDLKPCTCPRHQVTVSGTPRKHNASGSDNTPAFLASTILS